mgnify:CR=1 FL=1
MARRSQPVAASAQAQTSSRCVLGVDPGLNITGYAVLARSARAGSHPTIVDAGVIRTRARASMEQRLVELHAGLCSVLDEHAVGLVACERLYAHYAHPRTAILMGHARGVLLLAAAQRGLPCADLPSTEVKRVVSGFGHAGKGQIQRAVAAIFGLSKLPSPPDVADAIAIALTALARADAADTLDR